MQIRPQVWQRVKEIFDAALELPDSQRRSYLDQACSDDPILREEVEYLLQQHREAGSFMERSTAPITEPVFSPGLLLSGRFRIVRLLGRGGMGEVYEAEDLELRERVALKTIRGENAEDSQAIARFRQEIHLARKVTHPNVCRIYDIERHQSPETGPIAYLTMELLEGETLAQRLARDGPLDSRTAGPVIQQFVAALAAAHKAGITHRDFKSANIMLVPRAQAVPRAVVTDFGLARKTHPAGQSETLTRTGEIAGTPAYMAPEQLEGRPATPATDVYALGIVLHEMLTGTRPARGPDGAMRLQSIAGSKWRDAIARCLEYDPQRRFPTAAEVQHALEGDLPVHAALAALRLPRRKLIAGAFTIAAICLLAAAYRWWTLRAAEPPAEARRWYEEGVTAIRDGSYYKAAGMLGRAVSVHPDYVLAHARLAESWMELDYADKSKEEMLRALQPEHPAALSERDTLVLQAIHHTLTRDYGGATSRYEEIVRGAAGIERAYALVDLGRAYENQRLPRKATESFEEAARLAPEYAAPLLRLGILYSQAHESAKAENNFVQAESFYQKSSNLEGLTELLYDRGRFANAADRLADARRYLEKALELARTAANPHLEIKTLLQLSNLTFHEGHPEAAAKLASDALAKAHASRVEILAARGLQELGSTLFVAGNYEKAEEYFRRALELAQDYHVPRLDAMARFSLGSLYIKQGKSSEGLQMVRQALPYFEQSENKSEALAALVLIGRANRRMGDYEASLQAFRNVLQLAQKGGDKRQMALAQEGIASVRFQQEQYPQALDAYTQAYEASRQAGDQLPMRTVAMHAGNCLWRMGRYEEAGRKLDEAAGLGSSYKSLLVSTLRSRAEMLLSQAKDKEADTILRAARKLSDRENADARASLKAAQCRVSAATGAARQALETCREAVDLARGTADPWLIGEARIAQAYAYLAVGDAKSARSIAEAEVPDLERTQRLESLWRLQLIAALAARSAGDREAAQNWAAKAAHTLSGVGAAWGGEYQTYIARPDVQHQRKQLNSLGAQAGG